MRKSKSTQLIAKLNAAEFNKLNDFFRSPYFNKNPLFLHLMDFYAIHYPGFDKAEFGYEVAFESCFPEESFDKVRMMKLLSRFYQLLKTFIAHELATENEDVAVMRFLNRRNLPDLFPSEFKAYDKRLETQSKRNHWYTFKKYQYFNEFSEYESSHIGIKGSLYETLNHRYDDYFLCQKLYFLCTLANYEKVRGTRLKSTFEEETLNFYQENESRFKEKPAINLWFQVYKMLVGDEKRGSYQKLIRELSEIHQIFDRDEVAAIYAFMENTLGQIAKSPEEYHRENLKLMQTQLINGFYGSNVSEGLPCIIYHNIVQSAIFIDELSWASNFIDEYKDKLLGSEAEQMYQLNRAKLFFAKKEFHKTFDIINAINYKNLQFKTFERILRLKIYYELEMTDLFSDFVNGYRRFLSGNKEKMNKVGREILQPFVNVVNRIFFSNDSTDFDAIKKEIESRSIFADKKWVLEKLEERRRKFKK